jgi:hypothetical protein
MRTVSLKSLCLLAGFLVPCLGTTSRAEAGVIPWLYNSIFGYGWGHNYGGYGGGVPYTAGYGSMGYGYGGYGSAAYMPAYAPAYSNYGYSSVPNSCGCSTGLSSAPVMPTPTFATPTPAPSNAEPNANDSPPKDGIYKLEYQPAVGNYDYYTGYSPAYVVDYGSCCVPCLNCTNGDCGTSIKSTRPAADPTPAELPAGPKKKDPSADDFSPTKEGGAGSKEPVNINEALPADENKPANRLGSPGDVGTDSLEPPVNNEGPPPGTNEQGGAVPSERSIAVRYNPSLKRSPIAVPKSVARVVRIDRSTRIQTARIEPKSQLASKP